jgi:hypothetical protein
MTELQDEMMENAKDLMIQAIEAKARGRVTQLSYRLLRASPREQDLILAELEFQHWLAETCELGLERNDEIRG